jgi:hypothetical protein
MPAMLMLASHWNYLLACRFAASLLPSASRREELLRACSLRDRIVVMLMLMTMAFCFLS